MTRLLDAINRASTEDLVWFVAFVTVVEFLAVGGCSCATSTATPLPEVGCVEVFSARDAGRP